MTQTILPFVLVALCTACILLLAFVYVKYVHAKKTLEAMGPAEDGTTQLELRAVFNSITDFICIVDRRFHICQANSSYLKSIGKKMPEVADKPCYKFFWNREIPCDQCPARETFQNGNAVLRRKVMRRGREGQTPLEISVYPIYNPKKEVVHAIELIRDLTEEYRMLDELIRSEKLAGIGIMTTGIAHEMNNALSGITGTASNLLTMPEKFGLSGKAIDRIMAIMDSATRATAVMKNLLQFSNPLQEETRIMVNLRQVIKKVVPNALVQEAPDIDRRIHLDDRLPPIRADISKIELVLVNVISNAIRSIEEKKKQSLRENEDFRGLLVVSARYDESCDSVRISVEDNGIGIPESIGPKVFDPFFSTWPESKGTGLGLSTALHIAEEHGGRIAFESMENGTMFTIVLPIDRRPPREETGKT